MVDLEALADRLLDVPNRTRCELAFSASLTLSSGAFPAENASDGFTLSVANPKYLANPTP